MFISSQSRRQFMLHRSVDQYSNFNNSDEIKQSVCDQGALPSLLEYTKQGQVQISKSITKECLEVGSVLGRGTFAVVHEGKLIRTALDDVKVYIKTRKWR